MKATLASLVLSLAVVSAVLIGGCGRSKEAAGPKESAKPSAPAQSSPASASLGTPQQAGPFEVILSTEPASPKVGNNAFVAKVARNGQPVKNASVSVDLSMPGMGGPSAKLESTATGYQGAADLSVAGQWQAKVNVSDGKDTGTATYSFTVAK